MNSVPAAHDGSPAADRMPAAARLLATVGAGLLVALPPAMWLANRSSPLLLGLATAAMLASAILAQGFEAPVGRLRAASASPIGLALVGVLLWALISVSWSHRPLPGLAMWGELALPLACGLALVASDRCRPGQRLVRALGLSLVATSALILTELAFGLSERVALGLGKGMERTDVFNRPVLTCLVLMAAIVPPLWAQGKARALDRVLAVAAASAVSAAILVSESGAAKFGLVVMAMIWLLARLAPRLAIGLVALGFAVTMLLAPVVGRLADAAIPAPLHQSLASSHSRDRVDIWLSFGEAIAARPLIGSGFGATAALQAHPVAAEVSAAHRAMLAVGHPHSAPIQAWAETGLIGAGLLAAAGLACLARLAHLPAPALAPRLALFASAFAVASVAHGAWQGWWAAALSLAAALLWLDRSRPPSDIPGDTAP